MTLLSVNTKTILQRKNTPRLLWVAFFNIFDCSIETNIIITMKQIDLK